MKALIEQLTRAFDNLSAREQVMVIFLSLAIVGMIFGFGGYFVNKDLKARQRRIVAKSEKLAEISALRSDYQRRLAEQESLARRVRTNNNMRLLSYLDKLANQSKVVIKGATERAGEATGSDQVKESAAEVRVDNVSLDRLHDFLRRIEEGNTLVKIRKLRIKTRFDNKKMLDASITVGTYKTTDNG